MNRYELADAYHQKGFNCCQAVLAAFSDITGLNEQESFNVGGGFGAGAQTGELCGAVVGAVMTLGLLHPIDPADPVAGKKRSGAQGKEFQRRFVEKFDHLRCQDLLPERYVPDEATPAAKTMGLSNHCAIMIVTAVELLEQLLKEDGIAVKCFV